MAQGDTTGEPPDSGELFLSAEQLEALQHGVAATIMPVASGWRVQYFSGQDFDGQPGTTFPSFAAALAAIGEVLPRVNSEEERARARADLQALQELSEADEGHHQ